MPGNSTLRSLRFGALGFLLFSLPLFAQLERGTIVGQLRVAKSTTPPPRTLVALEARGAILGSTYSDSEGRFAFVSLIANTYYLVVDAEGFMPVREQARFNPSVDRNLILRITLIPKEAPQPRGTLLEGANPHVVSVEDFLSRFPKLVQSAYQKGLKAEKKGKPDEAIGHYRRVIGLAPDFYPARNNLGTILMGKGEFQAAQAEFEEVIRIHQEDAAGYFNLGNVLLLTQRYDDAMGAIQEGLRKQPDHPFGHFLLGTLNGRLGRLPESEHSLREALRLDPTMSKPHLELVNLYLRQQRTADAITELRQFVEIFPSDPMTPKAKEVLARLEAAPAQAAKTQ